MYRLFKGKLTAIFLAVFFSVGAHAKLMIIDFDSASVTNIFGYTTDAFDDSAYGFSSLSYDDVISSVMGEVVEDYLGNSGFYPSLPLGWELDIDFQVGNVGTPPVGLTDYFYFRVGEIGANSPTTSSLGHACYQCALNSFYSGATVGSVFTDNIASVLGGLASSDDELINLIVGTLSHEIGHALGLLHPSGRETNPGESEFGLMATGASPTSMPNRERLKDRAFSYANFDILIENVGIRRQIPSPSSLALMLLVFGFGACRQVLVTNKSH